MIKSEIVVISGCWPSKYKGYELACNSMVTLLNSLYDRVLYFGPADEIANLDKASFSNVEFFEVDFIRRSVGARFLRSLISSKPAITVRFWNGLRQVSGILSELKLSNPDFLYEDIPASYLLSGLKEVFPMSKHIVRSHNVVYEGFSNMPKIAKFPINLLWKYELLRIEKFELQVAKNCDVFLAISNKDKLSYQRDGVYVDGVVDLFFEYKQFSPLVDNNSNVLFIGTADLRKGGALREFTQCCWPLVINQVPKAKLICAGKGTEFLSDANRRIVGLGFVDSEASVMNQGNIFINPQLDGSGIKIKSIFAMQESKALVSTSIGIEGIGAKNQQDFILADSWSEMAQKIIDLIESPVEVNRLAKNANDFVNTFYCETSFRDRTQGLF